MAAKKKAAKKATSAVAEDRLALGRAREDGQARFPAAPPVSELPGDYGETLRELKAQIQKARLRTVLAANAAMIELYWRVGTVILARQAEEGWGTKVIDRLSADLRTAFPDMQGLSARNLKYMRAFAAAWTERVIVQRVAAQIPWRQHQALLDKLDDQSLRVWYAKKTAEEGWSRDILALQMDRRLHERQGKALTNFPTALPPADSDMAAQIFKDPYLFDMLGTADPRREAEVEQALIDHVQKFLLELGAGFAFVGRQVALEVGGSEFRIDLLFYHLKLRRFVVIELKSGAFKAEYAGKMNLYLSAVDDMLKHADDRPSIGLLLCRSRENMQVEYALRGIAAPIGVANWEKALVEKLPKELEGVLPTVEQIEAEFAPKKRGK